MDWQNAVTEILDTYQGHKVPTKSILDTITEKCPITPSTNALASFMKQHGCVSVKLSYGTRPQGWLIPRKMAYA